LYSRKKVEGRRKKQALPVQKPEAGERSCQKKVQESKFSSFNSKLNIQNSKLLKLFSFNSTLKTQNSKLLYGGDEFVRHESLRQ